MKQYVFFVQMQSHFWLGWLSQATFGTLVFYVVCLTSHTMPEKPVSFGKRSLRHFAMCTNVLKVSEQKF